jgi:hypothetical protein
VSEDTKKYRTNKDWVKKEVMPSFLNEFESLDLTSQFNHSSIFDVRYFTNPSNITCSFRYRAQTVYTFLKNMRTKPGSSSSRLVEKPRIGLQETTPAEMYARANQEWWEMELPSAKEVGCGVRLTLWRKRRNAEMAKFNELPDAEKEEFIKLAVKHNEEASGPATRESIIQ